VQATTDRILLPHLEMPAWWGSPIPMPLTRVNGHLEIPVGGHRVSLSADR